jgi:hypothetical protein
MFVWSVIGFPSWSAGAGLVSAQEFLEPFEDAVEDEVEGVGICLSRVVALCLSKMGFPPLEPASARTLRSFSSRTIRRE